MKEVINGLRENQIISSKNIEDIKKYINEKYPACDSKRSAVILADAVYKIIDRNIKTFSEEERKIIKRRALRRASRRDKFSIDSYDIFVEYLSVFGNNTFDESILNWLNENQSAVVTKEDMLDFSKSLDEHDCVSLETAIEKVIEDEEYADYNTKTNVIPTEEIELQEDFPKQKNPLVDIAVDFKDAFLRWSSKIVTQFSDSIEDITHNPKLAALSAGIILTAILVGGIYKVVERDNSSSKNIGYQISDEMYQKEAVKATKWEDNLSWELRYTNIDITALRNWLNSKNSLLANEPYFSAIINAGKVNDVNPLLLFAITGQEQNFVPRNQKNAAKIANNPFNVYGSWVQYNTNINDSARTAAKTIASLGRNRPTAVDEIQWVNRKYAQDKNWWVGVRKIFNKMKNDINNK